MKNVIVIILMIVTVIGNSKVVKAQNKNKERDAITVKVDGLGCPFCAYGLEKKFKELKVVKDVKIELETGIFTFTYPAADTIGIEKIKAQVDKAGYTPVQVDIVRADGSIETSVEDTATENVVEANASEQIFVAGNCGMCKARIEKAAKDMEGVNEANWDKKTQILQVDFDNNLVSTDSIATIVATAGHDTNTAKANDAVYEDLPGCCHYDRVK